MLQVATQLQKSRKREIKEREKADYMLKKLRSADKTISKATTVDLFTSKLVVVSKEFTAKKSKRGCDRTTEF